MRGCGTAIAIAGIFSVRVASVLLGPKLLRLPSLTAGLKPAHPDFALDDDR
jgi:hypothetical protein